MKLALVGIGKIAVDQHVPSISESGFWELSATVSRNGRIDGVEAFTDINTMLAARPDIEAVSLCVPPQPRFAYAAAALRAGRHVMLEKPPGQTLAEVQRLSSLAEAAGVTLFATWHSRAARAVAAAKVALKEEEVVTGHITWRESVRRWHPGQEWIFEAGGFGVLDPGINALSILTHVLPAPVHVERAVLEVPEGRQTPIAAQVHFSGGLTADFDWREEETQTWSISLATQSGGRLHLTEGGAAGTWNGTPLTQSDLDEYPGLYADMARLVEAKRSDVDLTPFVLVSDILAMGTRAETAAFTW